MLRDRPSSVKPRRLKLPKVRVIHYAVGNELLCNPKFHGAVSADKSQVTCRHCWYKLAPIGPPKPRKPRKVLLKATSAGRIGASASAPTSGLNRSGQSHKPFNGAGVTFGKVPGNSPSDIDGATMSRASEASVMSTLRDR